MTWIHISFFVITFYGKLEMAGICHSVTDQAPLTRDIQERASATAVAEMAPFSANLPAQGAIPELPGASLLAQLSHPDRVCSS